MAFYCPAVSCAHCVHCFVARHPPGNSRSNSLALCMLVLYCKSKMKILFVDEGVKSSQGYLQLRVIHRLVLQGVAGIVAYWLSCSTIAEPSR